MDEETTKEAPGTQKKATKLENRMVAAEKLEEEKLEEEEEEVKGLAKERE